MQHTLKTISSEFNVSYRTVQRWFTQASNKYGSEFGTLDGKTRYFTDTERSLIVDGRKAPEVETVDAEFLGDPFSGVSSGGAIDLYNPEYTQRGGTITDVEHQVSALCNVSRANAEQYVQGLVGNGNQIGEALGAFMGQQIIQSAEAKKNQLLRQYAASQGVNLGKSQPVEQPSSEV